MRGGRCKRQHQACPYQNTRSERQVALGTKLVNADISLPSCYGYVCKVQDILRRCVVGNILRGSWGWRNTQARGHRYTAPTHPKLSPWITQDAAI